MHRKLAPMQRTVQSQDRVSPSRFGGRFTVAVASIALLATVAIAQPYDGVGDCERFATAYYKRGSDFRSFVIDRNNVEEVGFDDKVGARYVAAIFRGRAFYTDRRGRRSGTFICLHGGP